ncbi:MAG: alpha/beta fold hydrolase [Solirubrobacterales bacterium]|nr:alpha/beta fold hydrolase [Solirubrobacterales bacterium]
MPAPVIEHAELRLHGHRVSYRTGGQGPLLVLVHGITNSSSSWAPVLPLLAEHFTILAPDLPGHGASDKPRGDYSLGAHACVVRDLMVALGHERGTIVGHSLGGGITMQLSYQFPERVERLVLCSSGGLGQEVSLLLRAVALPAAEYVLPLLASGPLLNTGRAIGRALGRVGLFTGSDVAEMAAGFASLRDAQTQRAFVHTARAVIDLQGQRVSATNKLYLAQAVPTLLLWGERDPIIPAEHGVRAHALMPGSRLEIFDDAGHFPHHDDPVAFAHALRDFVAETEPADVDADQMRDLVVAHSAATAATAV